MQTCRNEAEVEMMESKMLINEKEYNIQPFEDLHGADLHGAKLYGADLHGADLYGADLRGAINFSKALISDCKMKQESEMDEEKGGFDIREAFRIVLDLARQMKLDNAELRACEIVEAAGESLCDEEDEENAEEQAMRHLGEGI